MNKWEEALTQRAQRPEHRVHREQRLDGANANLV
jgi:hypothetical protein